MLIFDIETKPLPAERLKKLMPRFDPDSVAVGNFDRLSDASADEQRKVEVAVAYLRKLSVPQERLAKLLNEKLRKTGVKTEGRARWRRDLSHRMAAGL